MAWRNGTVVADLLIERVDMYAQAAAVRIRSAQEDRDEAQAQAQQRSSEAAEARRKAAELEGALSVSSNAQVPCCHMAPPVAPPQQQTIHIGHLHANFCFQDYVQDMCAGS